MGPRTGRGMGFCNGYEAPGYANPGPGLGRGMGRGWGRGMGMGRGMAWGRNWQGAAAPAQAPAQPVEPAETAGGLQAVLARLENAVAGLAERLDKLEKKS